MLNLLVRHFAAFKAPWLFNQQSPVVPLRSLSSSNLESQILFSLSEGFLYAFDSLCDSFSTLDTSSLEQCLEPSLFSTVSSLLASLSSSDYSFSRLPSSTPSLSLSNLQISTGVHLDRSLNPSKSSYMMIKSIEEMKKHVPMDMIRSQVKKEGLSVNENILNSCMDYAWLYISPAAPANLVLAVDVVYRGLAPLTLLRNGEDVVYKEKTEEVHVLRFESEAVQLGLQKDVMSLGKFGTIFQQLKEQKSNLLTQQWIITDIDHILAGNPYVK
jgi:hypothetical protein